MSSSVKNYFYACALSVCCACNMVCGMNEQNSANGVIINSGELRITNATQLLQLNENDVIGVNSVVLDGIDVNYDTDMKLSYLFSVLDSLSYINCRINEYDILSLSGIYAKNYSIVNCSMTAEYLAGILSSFADNYMYVKNFNFANNMLSSNEDLLFKTLFNEIFGCMSLESIDMRNNNLSEHFKNRFNEANRQYRLSVYY